MVAPGMLQNPSVMNWLGTIEPAWTLLDQVSFAALRGAPSPTAGLIRLASDLTSEEIQQSVVARNALISLPVGCTWTACCSGFRWGGMSNGRVAQLGQAFYPAESSALFVSQPKAMSEHRATLDYNICDILDAK